MSPGEDTTFDFLEKSVNPWVAFDLQSRWHDSITSSVRIALHPDSCRGVDADGLGDRSPDAD
jgi:hypothetical protein